MGKAVTTFYKRLASFLSSEPRVSMTILATLWPSAAETDLPCSVWFRLSVWRSSISLRIVPKRKPIKCFHLGSHSNYSRLHVHEIEHSTFTPLVLSTTRGMGKATTMHLLQKTHFLPLRQKGRELQSNYGLAEMMPEFRFIAVLNYVHHRC